MKTRDWTSNTLGNGAVTRWRHKSGAYMDITRRGTIEVFTSKGQPLIKHFPWTISDLSDKELKAEDRFRKNIFSLIEAIEESWHHAKHPSVDAGQRPPPTTYTSPARAQRHFAHR